MAIPIMKREQQGSMGRRLMGMALPIAGGALLGPAGAAAGSMLGSKLNGASTPDAIMGGAQAGISAHANAPAKGVNPVAGQEFQKLEMPEMGSAFSRRFAAKSQDPAMVINEGLGVLSSLPADHPLKAEYAPALVRAKMTGR